MSIIFDGANDLINCGSGATIDNVFNGGGSLLVRFKPTGKGSSNYPRIFNKGANLIFVTDDGVNTDALTVQMGFDGTDGIWDSNDNIFPFDGSWHTLVVSYNNGSTSNDPVFYRDGVSITVVERAAPSGTRLTDASDTLFLANRGDGARAFQGEFEDYRLIDRIVTAKEVSIYHVGYRGVMGGEVLWLDMNMARSAAGGFSGSVLANGTNILPDLSGNGNDGDPTGNPVGAASDTDRYGVAV